ncbi:MAG: hypothetical protein KBG28_18740 [Kofleriaceae bacterium]|jgi:hypothetical protein|nr:hypothetical protein [Kofleriaceae bacterium]MBP6835688.1 hypothetical protein [Kofleriaceae bacterium]MBP9206020.1 hypothetical protein [Kofleriaceae bacterium]
MPGPLIRNTLWIDASGALAAGALVVALHRPLAACPPGMRRATRAL